VITRELYRDDDDGKQSNTQIIVEFIIVPISEASEAPDAAGLNMKEAVTQAKTAVDNMKLAPPFLGPVQGALDTSATVINNVQSLSNTWGPFLQKIKMFTDLVDGITEVRHGSD
jgi:hypothetical protein